MMLQHAPGVQRIASEIEYWQFVLLTLMLESAIGYNVREPGVEISRTLSARFTACIESLQASPGIQLHFIRARYYFLGSSTDSSLSSFSTNQPPIPCPRVFLFELRTVLASPAQKEKFINRKTPGWPARSPQC